MSGNEPAHPQAVPVQHRDEGIAAGWTIWTGAMLRKTLLLVYITTLVVEVKLRGLDKNLYPWKETAGHW